MSDSGAAMGVVRSMAGGGVMEVQFIGSVAVITSDPSASRGLYVDAHGLPLAIEPDG